MQPGRSPDVFVPMLNLMELVPWGFRPANTPSLLEVRGYWWAQVMARLKPGVDERAARAKLDGLFQQFVPDALPEIDRATPPHIGLEAGSGGLDALRGTYRQPLYLMMGMVGLVLLIACANVAVLLLARAMSRRREFALRLSLGAGRGRLVRQLLTESLLMAGAGGLLGLVFAGWTSRGLMLLVPPDRRPQLLTDIDLTTFAFAAAISAVTAILFGLAPAILATRVDLLPAMKQAGSGAVQSEHPATKAWSTTFVVVQIALSLVLLVAATLFVRTLTNLQRQSLGVDDKRLLVFGVDASQNGYTGDRLASLYMDLIKRLAAVPGAEAASAARLRLFSGWVSNGGISIPGVEPKASMNLNTNAVGPDFARTTGMRVIAGRDITWSDIEGKRRVAVVTEEMARYFFGDVNAVGRRYSSGNTFNPAADFEIIGVVSNARYTQVRGAFPRTAYIPFNNNRGVLRGLYFHVRAAGDPLALGNVRPLRRPGPRSRAGHRRDELDDQPGRRLALAGTAVREADDDVQRAGAGARVHRPLRDDLVRRRPPPQRDRGADGARRAVLAGAVDDPPPGGHPRHGRGGGRRAVVHLGEHVRLDAAVRLDRAGSRHADTHGADVDSGRVRGGISSRAPGGAGRSGSCAETGLVRSGGGVGAADISLCRRPLHPIPLRHRVLQ